MAPLVDDVADVDGLLVGAGAADALEGGLHRHVLFQVHKLRSHDAAGGVVGVLEDLVDALAHLRVGVLEDALDHVGGHLLHNVNGIVQIQLVQHFLQLRVGKALDQQLLLVGVQLHEYLRCLLLGQQAEDQRHLFVQLTAQRGNIRRLHGKKEVAQVRVSFSGDILLNLFQQLFPFSFQLKHAAQPPFRS